MNSSVNSLQKKKKPLKLPATPSLKKSDKLPSFCVGPCRQGEAWHVLNGLPSCEIHEAFQGKCFLLHCYCKDLVLDPSLPNIYQPMNMHIRSIKHTKIPLFPDLFLHTQLINTLTPCQASHHSTAITPEAPGGQKFKTIVFSRETNVFGRETFV